MAKSGQFGPILAKSGQNPRGFGFGISAQQCLTTTTTNHTAEFGGGGIASRGEKAEAKSDRVPVAGEFLIGYMERIGFQWTGIDSIPVLFEQVGRKAIYAGVCAGIDNWLALRLPDDATDPREYLPNRGRLLSYARLHRDFTADQVIAAGKLRALFPQGARAWKAGSVEELAALCPLAVVTEVVEQLKSESRGANKFAPGLVVHRLRTALVKHDPFTPMLEAAARKWREAKASAQKAEAERQRAAAGQVEHDEEAAFEALVATVKDDELAHVVDEAINEFTAKHGPVMAGRLFSGKSKRSLASHPNLWLIVRAKLCGQKGRVSA